MEKIYTQEQGQKGKKKSQLNFSVILSFAVAIFALFSIAMFGVFSNQGSNVSYAAPTGDTFTGFIPNPSSGNVVSVMGISDANEYFNVPLYYADSVNDNNRVFCVEFRNDFGDETTYSKADTSDDAGLIYILNNTYASGVKKFDPSSTHGDYSKYIEIWGTQASIWLYLAEKYPNDTVHTLRADGEIKYNGNPLDTKKALEGAKTFQLVGGPETMNSKITDAEVAKKVRALVDEAKKQEGNDFLDVNVSHLNDKMVKTPDGKYYQTPLISVSGTPANSLKSYDITSITGVDGVKVVDENGADLTLTNIPIAKKFYLRIPINKVGTAAKTLKVNVSGNFTIKSAVHYTSNGYQKVVSLVDVPKQKAGGTQFEITGSPDTGMNAAQTIYFIGLIVLLCGVGIVYANAKPVESKQ